MVTLQIPHVSFSFKQFNLFYAVQKHKICPFMETVPYEEEWKMFCLSIRQNLLCANVFSVQSSSVEIELS